MADTVAVKRALARLASDADADADRAVIAQASAAVDDLDAAVSFVEDVGVARLAVAVERQRSAGNTAAVARGERTLEAFRRYRQAAGTTTQTQPNQPSTTPPDSGERVVSESESVATTGPVPNGDVGGQLDLELFEPRLESVGVGIEPVDGDRRSEPVRRTEDESGDSAAGRGSVSGWRTLEGDQFHSHSGYGNGLGTASEEGRR